MHPLGGTAPCPEDMGCHLSFRKRLLDSEIGTHAPVLSVEGSSFFGAVERGKRGVVSSSR